MKEKLKELNSAYERLCGYRDRIDDNIKEQKSLLRRHKRRLKQVEQAKHIIERVAQETQNKLVYSLSEPVSLALSTVFDDPYELKVEFTVRRNQTECDLMFSRNDTEIDPMEASGGGTVDIAQFGLRMARYVLGDDSRPLFILDQPTHQLSSDLQYKAGMMFREVADSMMVQIIAVTHNPEFAESAEKVWRVTNNNGESFIKEKHKND